MSPSFWSIFISGGQQKNYLAKKENFNMKGLGLRKALLPRWPPFFFFLYIYFKDLSMIYKDVKIWQEHKDSMVRYYNVPPKRKITKEYSHMSKRNCREVLSRRTNLLLFSSVLDIYRSCNHFAAARRKYKHLITP